MSTGSFGRTARYKPLRALFFFFSSILHCLLLLNSLLKYQHLCLLYWFQATEDDLAISLSWPNKHTFEQHVPFPDVARCWPFLPSGSTEGQANGFRLQVAHAHLRSFRASTVCDSSGHSSPGRSILSYFAGLQMSHHYIIWLKLHELLMSKGWICKLDHWAKYNKSLWSTSVP